ncbi:MAG: inorganic triphosphatase, partial [Alphaproteobacteria bacterium]|nr:inorganic triphosphatase [Alphaproteobacteria bacterium]
MASGVDRHEIELTLRLDPDSAKHLISPASLSGLRTGRPRTRRLHSIYFDTVDGHLRAHRV